LAEVIVRSLTSAVVLMALLSASPQSAAAQPTRPPTSSRPLERPEIPPPLPISPGGAFWRALLIPGWGHAAIGSYTRGGVYFGAQAATLYAYASTRVRLTEANRSLTFREDLLRRELANEGVTDPEEIQSRLEGDAVYSELQLLVDSRESQQEDLLAFSIFLVLLSSADAYVSAHLARFPDPLDVEAAPSPWGGIDLALRLPLPR
jgi:hypothetical protein